MSTPHPVHAFDVRVSASEGKLLLVRGMDAFELDEVAADVWHACDGTRSADDIAKLLTERYDVSYETARADTERFLRQLHDAGLLEA